jgi:hypothetical protein
MRGGFKEKSQIKGIHAFGRILLVPSLCPLSQLLFDHLFKGLNSYHLRSARNSAISSDGFCQKT